MQIKKKQQEINKIWPSVRRTRPTFKTKFIFFTLHTYYLSSSSSSSAFNVRGPHITQAWDVRHPRWHGSDGCPQQHSVVSCTNSTTFNGSGYTRLCQGSSMNSWLTWGYWYMFLLLKELLQPDGLPAPTHPLGRGVFNETPSLNELILAACLKLHCNLVIMLVSGSNVKSVLQKNSEGLTHRM